MRRSRTLLASVALVAVASASAIGWTMHQAGEAERWVAEAERRLRAPIVRAPELHRIQASSAISRLERAQALGRQDDELQVLLHWARALEHLQRRDLIFAEGEVRTARQIGGWNADLRVLAGTIARAAGDTPTAEAHAEAARTLAPRHPRVLLLVGDLALDRGDARTALEVFGPLAARASTASVVHNRLGLARELSGDLTAAQHAYREAVRLDRKHTDGWVNLGRVLRRTGAAPEAAAAFARALALDPQLADAALGRGLAWQDLGRRSDAEADFERAATLAPNDAEPVLALGDLALAEGEVDEAIARYREALRREDADAGAWVKLGNALVRRGDSARAARSFDEAIRRAPTLAAAHNGRGAALVRVGRAQDAAAALERAADLDPSDPNPWRNLAVLYRRQGDPARAQHALEEAAARSSARDPA